MRETLRGRNTGTFVMRFIQCRGLEWSEHHTNPWKQQLAEASGGRRWLLKWDNSGLRKIPYFPAFTAGNLAKIKNALVLHISTALAKESYSSDNLFILEYEIHTLSTESFCHWDLRDTFTSCLYEKRLHSLQGHCPLYVLKDIKRNLDK